MAEPHTPSLPGERRQTRRRLLRSAGLGAAAVAVASQAPAPAAAGIRPGENTGRVSERQVALLERRARSRFARNGNVRLHYRIAGRGPLVLFVHGFPGWWWTWRYPMAALMDDYTVAAMDLRAYNLSSKPVGVHNYGLDLLVDDVRAVIRHAGHRRATVVGHDWGGGIAWSLAIAAPEMVERLVILNAPHPWILLRELYENPAQQRASEYAQTFRRPNAVELGFQGGSIPITPETTAALLSPPNTPAYRRNVAAMRRTSLPGALSYYAANWPAAPYQPPPRPFGRIKPPTLVVFGREDPFVLVDCLSGLWNLMDRSLQLEVVAGAGHFVQDDARALFIRTLREWLAQPTGMR